MKYLLLFFSILLISSISADTTFFDNPNDFGVYQAPPVVPGLGPSPSAGGNIIDLLANGSIEYQNVTANVTKPTNQTITEINYYGSQVPWGWWIIIGAIVLYSLNSGKKDESE